MSSSVTHSVDSDGVGWIVFDDPSSRANVFNPAVHSDLRAAVAALAAQSVRAVVIASAKERIFIAGADLKWLNKLPDPAAATAASRDGQASFDQVAGFKVPVVCAIHGACAGGGYELALACHWRIASDARETVIGLPETGIGTIPGWGGTARLPRLIGAKAALDHILKAALVPAAEAKAAGLVDEVVPAKELKTRAKAAALRLAAEGFPVRSVPPAAGSEIFAKLRQDVAKRTRGREPAPVAAIEVIEKTAGRTLTEALAEEARVFGGIMVGETCRNLIHVFFLKEAVKKLTVDAWFPPAAAAASAPFRKIGVVGAGVMGSGIAQWCAARGHEVVLRDVKPEFVERGLTVIRGVFDEAVARKKMTPETAAAGLARVKSTTGWDGFGECDLVIEAIVENVAAKQALFRELAAVVRPDCVLASNTSALPIEELSAPVTHPERTIGIHFFNPVSRMPLIELVLSPHTSRATAERTLAFAKALGKSPVICRSSPGFLVTRVLFFYLNEACRLWEEGVPTEVLDAPLRDWGWPMGPARLIDEVGVDVTDFIFGEMAHYFPDRFRSTTVCRRMLEAGLKGRKNGASSGFYAYADGKETLNPAMVAFAPAAKSALTGATIAERLNRVMIDETKRVLDEGVLKSADDADFALLMGTGFPAFRGGLMRHARSIGAV
ncbi:MAG TPA: 3-hydroxyacyl-CoA dehydrogenase NAD-binding domain-containing protein [Opitutaceae bacterium]|nr:3-hydroxyacyl-CoA dehydrogenase NAD-binding domain-containing protein [Opitutaceae bacterium]HND61008.1 3-hydroxyacyl-CoA dehydrogenase NAD-binding domain-containing protein [Opitutaceae bacterium]